jgi:hypothetical protein
MELFVLRIRMELYLPPSIYLHDMMLVKHRDKCSQYNDWLQTEGSNFESQ